MQYTCSTNAHTHKHFVSIKQCLKHLVQTSTILDKSVKHTFLAFL